MSPLGLSSFEASAGLSVRAFTLEKATDTAIVIANCWYSRPVMPPMKATGTNTAISTSEVAMTGPVTSPIASIVASRGDMPVSILAITASTTTMASSTTVPIASTSPSSDSVLIEKPSTGKATSAPISDTGTVTSGMSVARKFCRKTKTTRITRAIAWNSVTTISWMPASIASVVSREIVYSRSSGKRWASSSIVLLILSAISSAFVPGVWYSATTAAGLPSRRPIML